MTQYSSLTLLTQTKNKKLMDEICQEHFDTQWSMVLRGVLCMLIEKVNPNCAKNTYIITSIDSLSYTSNCRRAFKDWCVTPSYSTKGWRQSYRIWSVINQQTHALQTKILSWDNPLNFGKWMTSRFYARVDGRTQSYLHIWKGYMENGWWCIGERMST